MSRKTFIINANVSSVAFTRLMGIINLFASERELSKGSKLKDKFWLFGQNAGSHHSTTNSNNLPGNNPQRKRSSLDFSQSKGKCKIS